MLATVFDADGGCPCDLEHHRERERDTMQEELLAAWRSNNRINLYLLENITAEGLGCTLSRHGGRGVAGQFAHLHNVRVWQLEKRARDLAAGLEVFPAKVAPSADELDEALTASGLAVENFLSAVLAGEAKRRGFKRGIFTTLAYFIAHESHHRGNILATLKACGHPPDQNVRYALWNWDKI